MLGTELSQAYEQGNQQQFTGNNVDFIDSNDTQHVPPIPISNTPIDNNPQTRPPPQINEQVYQQPTYDSINMYKEAQLHNQLTNLQAQLHAQKNTEIKGDSVFDRYLSKKKDVLKLVTMALTVLLAISIHYVVTDLIRNYLANNDFTANKEFITKVSYPLTILLLIWTLKVFNR
jgi:uncharacterized membrane protein YcjF (UPF0283 family)